MAHKEESLFGLAPVATQHHSSTSTQLSPYEPDRTPTRQEQKVVDALRLERLVIEAQTAKTTFGMSQIAKLHEHGSATFDAAVAEVFAIKEQSRSKEHQAYIDEFSTRQLSMFGREMLGAMDVGATGIAFEIHRSLYPEQEQPEPRSVWKRLFG